MATEAAEIVAAAEIVGAVGILATRRPIQRLQFVKSMKMT
jgi:hypothetical protein